MMYIGRASADIHEHYPDCLKSGTIQSLNNTMISYLAQANHTVDWMQTFAPYTKSRLNSPDW